MSQLRISWHDSAWMPHLNQTNALDYFCQKSNPFYDKECNNEIAKMQRLTQEQMLSMSGNEYILLHAQDPILFVIRKQNRNPPNVKALADYYILAGIIYQAPDLNSIIQSRVLNSTAHLKKALADCGPEQFVTSSSSQDRHAELSKFQLRLQSILAGLTDIS